MSWYKKILSMLTALCMSIFAAVHAQAQILVVTNPGSGLTALTREQVVDIYMGRTTTFPGGRPAIVFDLKSDQPARGVFYQQLVGKSVAQMNAYWARLLFTGSATPPVVLSDSATMLNMVTENRDAIGYIDSSENIGNLRVVYRLEAAR